MSGPRASGGNIESRVGDLFSEAVERQVAEQRALNRHLRELDEAVTTVRDRIAELQGQIARDLVPAADHLAGLDRALQAIREQGSTQSVAVRAELKEGLEGLREELAGRVRALERRLEALAADRRPAEELTEHLRAGVADALGEGLGGVLEELTGRLGAVEEGLAGRLETVEDALGEIGAEQRELQASIVRAAGLASEAVEASEGAAGALTAHTARVESAVERAGDELRERLAETVGASLAGDLQALAGDVTSRVSEEVRPAREALRETGEALRTELEDLRDEVRAVRDEQRAEMREALEQRDHLQERIADRLDGFHARLNRMVEELESTGAEIRSDARRASSDMHGAFERLDAAAEHLSRLEASFVEYLEVSEQRAERARVGALRDLLGQLLEGLSARQRRRLAARLELPPALTASSPAPGRPLPPSAAAGGAPAGEGPTGVVGGRPTPWGAGGRGPRWTTGAGRGQSPTGQPESPSGPGTESGSSPGPPGGAPTRPPRQPAAGSAGKAAARPAGAPAANGPPGEAATSPAGAAPQDHVCEVCGFVARSAGGLGSHRRVHR